MKKTEGEGQDLKSALDESLAELQTLIKSEQTEDEIAAALADPVKAKRIEEMLKAKKVGKKKVESEEEDEAAEGESEEDEGEEEEPTEEEGEEEEEVPAKMKKSLDAMGAEAEQLEEFVSANDLIKSVVDTVRSVTEEVTALRAEVAELRKSHKIVGEVLVHEAEMVKSISDVLGKVAKTPLQVKGQFQKSSEGLEEGAVQNAALFQDAMLKAVNDKKIDGSSVTRFELGGGLTKGELSIIKSYIEKGVN